MAVIVCVPVGLKVAPEPIVKDAIAVILAPVVVVPPLISRLLKVVNTEDGNVLVPVKINLPAPGVHVLEPVPRVIAPPRLNVPPADIIIVPFAPAMVPPSLKLPAIRVEPLVKVIVPELPEILFPTVTAPETVSVEEFEKVSEPADAVAPVCPNWMLAHAEAAFTVTVNPRSMNTASPATGYTPAPTATPPDVKDHVVFAVQLPVALE